MVVVADAAIQEGRRAGLRTVAGVGSANASMAIASALGLSALFNRFPEVLHLVAAAGALYLAWLGLRALARAARGEPPISGGAARGERSMSRGAGLQTPEDLGGSEDPPHKGGRPHNQDNWFLRGLVTNYSNPSVVLFYTVLVPQFITAHDRFAARYLLLGGTHVAMSVVWLAAFAISVGTLARYMTRPSVRRAMDLLMGTTLLVFAVKIGLR